MSAYKVILVFPDGERDEQDEVFSTYEDAEEYGLYLIGCSREGQQVLEMVDPIEWPEEEYEDPECVIVEIDE